MKLINVSIVIIVMLPVACDRPGPSLVVDPSIKDSFVAVAKRIDTTGGNDGSLYDGMSAVIVPRMMGDPEEEEAILAQDNNAFEFPCVCAFANDTLSVVSAIAYEGGFAYISQATEKNVKTSLKLFGKAKIWKLQNGEWQNEIDVPSVKNKLILSEKLPLKMHEKLYGMFEVETVPYFERGEDSAKTQLHKLKLYFACSVSPSMPY